MPQRITELSNTYYKEGETETMKLNLEFHCLSGGIEKANCDGSCINHNRVCGNLYVQHKENKNPLELTIGDELMQGLPKKEKQAT